MFNLRKEKKTDVEIPYEKTISLFSDKKIEKIVKKMYNEGDEIFQDCVFSQKINFGKNSTMKAKDNNIIVARGSSQNDVTIYFGGAVIWSNRRYSKEIFGVCKFAKIKK